MAAPEEPYRDGVKTSHTPDWIAESLPRRRTAAGAQIWWGISSKTAIRAAVLVAILTLGILATLEWMPAAPAVQVPERFFEEHALESASTAGDTASEQTERGGGAADAVETIFVHVAGEVKTPGLIELALGARVAQAVADAGGATSSADLSAVNLAQVVSDGEQIYLPAIGEQAPEAANHSEATDDGSPINLNTATASELQDLPGIGPVMAERIIANRTEVGPFTSVDDLQRVSGVGPAIIGNIRDVVSL